MLTELMLKLAEGKHLDALERSELQKELRAVEEVKNLAKTWVIPGTQQPIFIPPMTVIYSKVLAEDTASLTIPIPGGYKHLMIMGQGRSTNAGTGNEFLNAEINGDTGTNYNVEALIGTGVTASADDTYLANVYFPVGFLVANGQDAGKAGTFFTFMPHYTSNFNKVSLMVAGYSGGTAFHIAVFHSQWMNTSVVKSMRLWGSANNMLKGSLISIYGIQ